MRSKLLTSPGLRARRFFDEGDEGHRSERYLREPLKRDLPAPLEYESGLASFSARNAMPTRKRTSSPYPIDRCAGAAHTDLTFEEQT
jgi:hypothetical protein